MGAHLDIDDAAAGHPQAARELAELRISAGRMRKALELIAAARRPDGTWNLDREACQQIALEALGDLFRQDEAEPLV